MTYKTEQENFWAGEFGNNYITRNNDKKLFAGKLALFSKIINRCNNVNSILEFGSNIGLNLQALQLLLPEANLSAIEINPVAAKELEKLGLAEIFNQSILDFDTNKTYDLTFTAGVLIHINPNELQNVYEKLYNCSNKYILIAEYYNPTPMEIVYRGHTGKLFKRDFAGEMLDKYAGKLSLIEYGFTYGRDNNFIYDNINWFLLKK